MLLFAIKFLTTFECIHLHKLENSVKTRDGMYSQGEILTFILCDLFSSISFSNIKKITKKYKSSI